MKLASLKRSNFSRISSIEFTAIFSVWYAYLQAFICSQVKTPDEALRSTCLIDRKKEGENEVESLRLSPFFMFYGKLLPSNICLQKQRNSKLVNLKSQAQAPLWREWDFLTVHFVRISICFFRMIFSGKDVCIGLSTTPYEALTLMFNWWEKDGGVYGIL